MTSTRPLILTSYLLQAWAALVGAFCLYWAVDSLLLDNPVWGALQAAITILNGLTFVQQAAFRHRLRGARQ